MPESVRSQRAETFRRDMHNVITAASRVLVETNDSLRLLPYFGWLGAASRVMTQLTNPWHTRAGTLPLLWLPEDEEEQILTAPRSSMYGQPGHRASATTHLDPTPEAVPTPVDAAQRRMGYQTNDPEETPHSPSSAQMSPPSIRDGAAPGERVSQPCTPQVSTSVAPPASDHHLTPSQASHQRLLLVRDAENRIRTYITERTSSFIAQFHRPGQNQYVIPAQGPYTVRWLLRFREAIDRPALAAGGAHASADFPVGMSGARVDVPVPQDSHVPQTPPIAGPSSYPQHQQPSTTESFESVQTSPAATPPRAAMIGQWHQADALRDTAARAESRSVPREAGGGRSAATSTQWVRDQVQASSHGIFVHQSVTVQRQRANGARSRASRPGRHIRVHSGVNISYSWSRDPSCVHRNTMSVATAQLIHMVRIPTAGPCPGEVVTYTSLLPALRGASIVFDWRGSLMSNWSRIKVDVRFYAVLEMERVWATVWSEIAVAVRLGHILESQVEEVWRAWLGNGQEHMEGVMEDSESEDEERMIGSWGDDD